MDNIYENVTFVSRYPVELKLYEKAKKRLAEGEADDTLFTARKSLEFFLKDFSEKCGLEAADNHVMIDNLKSCGLLAEHEVSVLHRLRLLGNTGGHGTGTMAQARECMELLEQAIQIFMEHDNESAFSAAAASGGDLTTDPQYYSTRRKYRGKWAFVYTRADLFSIPEYAALHRQAEQGDIAAMLDLAIGFVPDTPVWGANQLVCMPKCRGYYNDQYDACDTRYYYWVTRACNQALRNAGTGKPFPKKYMATALFDVIKFALRWSSQSSFGCYVSDVHGREPVYADQFDLVKELFGSPVTIPDFCGWVRLLLQLVRQAGTFDVVDRVHAARYQEREICYLAYCYCHLNNEALPGDLSIDTIRENSSVSFERLTACKPANGSCDVYYEFAHQVVLKEEAKARKVQEEKEREKIAREVAHKENVRYLIVTILIVAALIAAYTIIPYLNKQGREPVDPFASIEVTFEGTAPHGEVHLDTSANPISLKYVRYEISKEDNLSNGDKITIKVEDEKSVLKQGYYLTANRKKYVVSGLGEPVTDAKQLDDAILEQMTAQAQTIVEEELKNTAADVLCHYLVKDRVVRFGIMDYSGTVGDVTPVSAHFLQGKRLHNQENNSINRLVLFFQVPVSAGSPLDDIWYDDLAYYAVRVLDLRQDENGQPVIDFSNAHISDPYASYQDIYDDYVRQHLDTYEATELK